MGSGPCINSMFEAVTFMRKTSKHVIRDKFFSLKQAGRMVNQFVSELHMQVKDCYLGFDVAYTYMCCIHVLIRGIDNERRRFEMEKLDLAKAIQMCQKHRDNNCISVDLGGESKKN